MNILPWLKTNVIMQNEALCMPGSARGCADVLSAAASPKTQLLFFFFLKIVKNFSCQRNAHGALTEGGIRAEIKVQPDCTDWILGWYKSLPPAGLTNWGWSTFPRGCCASCTAAQKMLGHPNPFPPARCDARPDPKDHSDCLMADSDAHPY